jgi:predicted ribosomally synthesized peptide with SipW-like signal peptide
MNLRTVAFTGLASAAGLGLIGVGAHAEFTNSTSSQQSITAGTPAVYLSSPDSPGCTSATDECTSLPLPAIGPVGSTFDTTPSNITITNAGNIPVTEGGFQLSAVTNGPAGNYLRDESYVCIASDPGSGGSGANGETVVANGPLDTGLNLSPSVNLYGPTLAPGATDEYNLDFYAGQNSTTCGATWSDGPHTAAAWSGATYPTINPWVTPASLDNNAEGGSVTVTVTTSFTS